MGELRHADRYTIITVRLIKGQLRQLDELANLFGQTRTELIRESIRGYMSVLLRNAEAVRRQKARESVKAQSEHEEVD